MNGPQTERGAPQNPEAGGGFQPLGTIPVRAARLDPVPAGPERLSFILSDDMLRSHSGSQTPRTHSRTNPANRILPRASPADAPGARVPGKLGALRVPGKDQVAVLTESVMTNVTAAASRRCEQESEGGERGERGRPLREVGGALHTPSLQGLSFRADRSLWAAPQLYIPSNGSISLSCRAGVLSQ